MTNFNTAWNYICFGEFGNWIFNDENGRMIVKVTENIDTLFPTCKCMKMTSLFVNLMGVKLLNGF